MKVLGIVSTGVLSLLVGAAAPACAQHEQHAQQQGQATEQQHAQPSKPEHAHHAQQSSPSAQHAQHAQQSEPSAQPTQHAQLSKPSAQHAQHTQQSRRTARHTEHAQQARASRPARQRQQAQRSDGDHGRRIPDDRFRANFGREHRFHIDRPTMVAGNPRFQYGGYWFGFYDPWPAGWYYTDDVYVDYIGGGYYLYNPVHPGIRISINVL